jgi:hypothetical protein
MKSIEQSDKCEKVESKLAKLKHNLSKVTAGCLILKESIEKLKKENVTLSKEKTQLDDGLMKSTVRADSIEPKIERVAECVGKKGAKDIKYLRKELYVLKQKIGRSVIQTSADKTISPEPHKHGNFENDIQINTKSLKITIGQQKNQSTSNRKSTETRGYLICTRGRSPRVLIRLPSVLMFFLFCIIDKH